MFTQQGSSQRYHRFGVRKTDTVLSHPSSKKTEPTPQSEIFLVKIPENFKVKKLQRIEKNKVLNRILEKKLRGFEDKKY